MSQLLRLHRMLAVSVAIAALFSTCALAQRPIRVVTDTEMDRSWRVVAATIDEGQISTGARLRLLNVSASSLSEARFYAEYFDEEGRVCFTLVYAGEVSPGSPENINPNPIAPGESRNLDAFPQNLSPISAPVEMRVHLISQRPVGGDTQFSAPDAIVRSPVTGWLPAISMSPAPGARSWVNLVRIHLDPSLGSSPVTDLALARVTVEAPGKAKAVEILDSADPAAKTWFEGLMREATFFPAGQGLVNQPGTSLVLLRLVNTGEGGPRPTLLPRESPWLRALAGAALGDDLPAVITWTLSPASTAILFDDKGREAAPIKGPDLFFVLGDSYWSDGPFRSTPTLTPRPGGGRARAWKSAEEFQVEYIQ